MQEIFCQKKDQSLLTKKEIHYGNTHIRKTYHRYMCLKTKHVAKESPYSTKNKVHFVDTLSKRTYFWG